MKYVFIGLVILGIFFAFTKASNAGADFRGWKELFFPPKDLFNVIAETSIDVSRQGETQSFNFNIKHKGQYNIGLLLSKYSGEDELRWNKYQSPLKIKMEYSSSEGRRVKEFTGYQYSFIGKNGNGVVLTSIECPNDLPKGEDIAVEVSILQPDIYMSEKYGDAVLFIKKKSEL